MRVLRLGGETVAFMGDGLNDALAMRESDVGISVDSGADLAKESADIILTDKVRPADGTRTAAMRHTGATRNGRRRRHRPSICS